MKIILIISFIFLTDCSAKFDSFDPSTTAINGLLTE